VTPSPWPDDDPIAELDRLLAAIREAIDEGLRRVRVQAVADLEERPPHE
jgi:hypothetical protein